MDYFNIESNLFDEWLPGVDLKTENLTDLSSLLKPCVEESGFNPFDMFDEDYHSSFDEWFDLFFYEEIVPFLLIHGVPTEDLRDEEREQITEFCKEWLKKYCTPYMRYDEWEIHTLTSPFERYFVIDFDNDYLLREVKLVKEKRISTHTEIRYDNDYSGEVDESYDISTETALIAWFDIIDFDL